MARIYLDAWCMKREPSGVSRYCRGLIPALIAAAPQHDFVILRPAGDERRDPLSPRTGAASVREVFVRRPGPDWTTLTSRPALDRVFREHGRADVYHSLFHLLPLGLRRGRLAPRRIVVTLHDLIWIDHAHLVERRWLAAAWLTRFGRAVIPHALRSADHVVCVSNATGRRAAEWLPMNRTTIVHHGVDERWFARPVASPAVDPYIAAFGVPKAYKNIRCLVRAFEDVRKQWPGLRLLLIGGDGGVGAQIRAAGLDPFVTVTGRIGDEDLVARVNGARLFVVPSLVEGFGLPALEAMAAGTPAIVSAIEALQEVTGDAALSFDPRSPAELAQVMTMALEDDALRRDLAERGRLRAGAFRWPAAAAATLAVYDRVLQDTGSLPPVTAS
jgi:glycosyltransferase involved in cell wall biosynthesis